MGGQISKMMGKIFGSKEMRLLMLGLDAAGKTSELLLYWATRGQWGWMEPCSTSASIAGSISP